MEDHSGVDDRRKYLRLRAVLFVCFSLDKSFYIPNLSDQQEIEASTIDISQGGMAIATRYNIPAKAILHIKCLLLGVDRQGEISFSRPVEVSGEVRYSAPINSSAYRLGISFTDIDQEHREQIGNYISSISMGTVYPCVQPR